MKQIKEYRTEVAYLPKEAYKIIFDELDNVSIDDKLKMVFAILEYQFYDKQMENLVFEDMDLQSTWSNIRDMAKEALKNRKYEYICIKPNDDMPL